MRVIFLLILIFLIQNVLAQQSDFEINAKKTIPASDTWETTLTITFSTVLQNGLLIETPVQLRLVPVSVTHDTKHLKREISNRIIAIKNIDSLFIK